MPSPAPSSPAATDLRRRVLLGWLRACRLAWPMATAAALAATPASAPFDLVTETEAQR